MAANVDYYYPDHPYGIKFVPGSLPPIGPKAAFDTSDPLYQTSGILTVDRTHDYRHTWTDWHLIPAQRVRINAPLVKNSELEVPGGNGKLDLSPILSYFPLFQNRTGTLDFYVPEFRYVHYVGDNNTRRIEENATWPDMYDDLLGYFQGRPRGCILDEEPNRAYVGKFTVKDFKAEDHWTKLTLEYDVHPYAVSRPIETTYAFYASPNNSPRQGHTISNISDGPIYTFEMKLADANSSGTVLLGGETITLTSEYVNYANFIDQKYLSDYRRVPFYPTGTGNFKVRYIGTWL